VKCPMEAERSPHPTVVVMEDPTLDIITGIAVPAASILVSTWVAIRLARSERRAASAAQAEERKDAAAARAEEREAAAAARVEERTDDAFSRALTALATLNTINLRAEPAAEPFRELRVALTLLDAATSPVEHDRLAEWFEAERLAGLAQAQKSMELLRLVPEPLRTDADVEKAVAAGEPVNTWARDFANNLRLWRREGATDAKLRTLIAAAKTSIGPTATDPAAVPSLGNGS